jgi:methylated-DNA-[protein]-cysteine S-methyltransferase
MKLISTTIATPVGPFTMAVSEESVVAGAFSARLEIGSEPKADLGPWSKAVLAYVEGDVYAIDDIPVAQPGGPFTAAARRAMRTVAPGQTMTYQLLAAHAGNPRAVRAAGTACATNKVALFVPCHRIIRTDGGLGGYAWGLDVKQWLLAHEAKAAVSA